VTFHSLASNLVAGDTNGTADVFVRDLALGTTERVSVASDGAEANDGSGGQVITPDGRFVVFQTSASNLSSADTAAGTLDIYIHDRSTGETEIVSVASDGTRPYVFESQNPSVSNDGRYIAFESRAALVAEDTDTDSDVYLRDRVAGTTELINRRPDGGQSESYSWIRLGHGISGDGRYIAFESGAPDLVPGDTNGWADVFLYDRTTETTRMISVTPGGSPGNSVSAVGSISGDGSTIAFSSVASDLVSDDTNGAQDIFVMRHPAASSL
jgi:Tol biopolymer transport system component